MRASGQAIEPHLRQLRKQVWDLKWGQTAACKGFRVRITDGPNFYMQYKDLFVRQIYHFDAVRPNPRVIDGGGNIGLALFYFKYVYPKASVVAFEPDPEIFALLKENVEANTLEDVELQNAGLGPTAGRYSFESDQSAGGQLTSRPDEAGVRVERLSDYLDEPVDFLKLNIEGYEIPVLKEIIEADKFRHVRELVVEYHGWPNGENCLGDLLSILREQGYRYLVHDFDGETCPASKPPFRWNPRTPWFCLVYGIREDVASLRAA